MLFNSIPFIILFPVAVLLYYVVPAKFRYVWLLALSYAFYYVQSEGFTALLVISTVITYITGVAVANIDGKKGKKAVLIGAVAIHLLILFVFKYLDFTLDLCGSGLRLNLVLPLGISFYTFQAISYIADVYSGRIEYEKNPLKLALFVSFFLSIVSGPINRAGDMLPQFAKPVPFSLERTKIGMQKMLWGYFLKLAIAGRLAIVVENVYEDASAYPGFAVAFAAVSYMFMLYCDFEGYSQIAIGSGYLLGITMKENFRQPFFSLSMSEMWRRWHVSLSSWFRDYLYIPLGGNRRGTVRKYVNIFIVLFLSGIWHGANLTFFVWGALNGAYIILGQILIPYRDKVANALKGKICHTESARERFERVRDALKRIGVYILFTHTFIYFANDSLVSAWTAVKSILVRFSPLQAGCVTTLGLGTYNLALTFIMAVFVLVADRAAYKKGCDTPSLIRNIPTPARWAIYYGLLIAILFSANLTGQEFIYSKM